MQGAWNFEYRAATAIIPVYKLNSIYNKKDTENTYFIKI